MKPYDIDRIRKDFSNLTQRANKSLGSFNDASIGIGRYLAGSSPWERHNNGDELLLVIDGEVKIEILERSGESWDCSLKQGTLFIVPKGKWHQLTASDPVNIFYISPSEDDVDRTREHPVSEQND